MIQAAFKRNGILLATLGVYVAATIGIVLSIDVMIYQAKKKEIIRDIPRNQLFPASGEARVDDYLDAQAEQWTLVLARNQIDGDAVESLRLQAREILEGPTSIYRIFVQDAGGGIVLDERASKFLRFNDFSNSLWIPRFTARIGSRLLLPPVRESLGMYFFEYTTPWPLPQEPRQAIEALTLRYRIATLLIAGLLAVLTLLFAWTVLIPMRNVIERIESSTPERTKFIGRPRTQLEQLYNRMARDAVLSRLHETLGERIQEDSSLTGWELVKEACDFLLDQETAAMAACVELREEGPGRLRPTGRTLLRREVGFSKRIQDEDLLSALSEVLGDASTVAQYGSEAPIPVDRRLGALRSVAALRLIVDPERPGVHYGLALSLGESAHEADGETAEDLLARLSAIIRSSLETLLSRNRTLERERGRASINLSRNLGHDLTNIIATSKLELMTLETLLGNGAPSFEGERREILEDSLRGLLDSTKFLQEVVNLYRAYAYLKQPILETCDINQLVEETVELFHLSTSSKVKFEQNLDPSGPRCRADPRLLKLALFNLFANAIAAIRRGEVGEAGRGTIRLATAASPEGAVISVEDNGPGILDEEGRPTGPDEIERVFTLGYSVGADADGEGLGLNWVRTIVQEIHGGTIRAENPPQGGARFTLTFPPIESRDAEPGKDSEPGAPENA